MENINLNNNINIEKSAIYVVATPIGNIEDITIRALKILNNVDFILAEDTRVTLKLLNAYNIKKPLYSYHSHSTEKKINEYINNILNGSSVAIVSDAGTPCISDPGVSIISKAIENNIKVIPIGGISAFTALLSASGISGNTLFVGFLSNKSGKRKNQLKELYSNEKNIIILYESVHRIKACIEDIVNIFGENTYVVIKLMPKIYYVRSQIMTIDKIGGTQNIQFNSKVKYSDGPSQLGSDKIEISNESKIALQNKKLIDIVKQSPEIREEKVAEAKKRLEMYMKDGALRKEVLNSLANSIIDAMPIDE